MEESRYQTPSDLPAHIPVFPLSGAMLFPRWRLPLNIFEPRYLNMIDDAMATHKLIGMIQTTGGDRARPSLASVGCVGEITDYSETRDGRYLITLQGVVRYRVETELQTQKPYREVAADYTPFADDMSPPKAFCKPDHEMIIAALEPYAEAKGLETEWTVIADAEIETLVSALSAGCPFDVIEKQALLETPDLKARTETLIQLMEMNTSQADGNEGQSLQ